MPHARCKPHSAQRRYGVLVGKARDGFENPDGTSPHYELLVEGAGDQFRVAVNVKSMNGSDVLACYLPAFAQPTKLNLSQLVQMHGFTTLPTGPDGQGLDYLRDGLFDLAAMQQIPPDGDDAGITLRICLMP